MEIQVYPTQAPPPPEKEGKKEKEKGRNGRSNCVNKPDYKTGQKKASKK